MNTPTTNRPLNVIAHEIHNDWGAKLNFAARPYVNAMCSLTDINSKYGEDSAREIVARFLCNAGTWRGEVAKRVKLELNKMIK